MATEILLIQEIGEDGVKPAFEAADAAGNFVDFGRDDDLRQEDTYIEIVNGGSTEITVTLETPGQHAGRAIEDKTVAVPAGETRKIGNLQRQFYGTVVNWAYSAVDSVTVGVFQLVK